MSKILQLPIIVVRLTGRLALPVRVIQNELLWEDRVVVRMLLLGSMKRKLNATHFAPSHLPPHLADRALHV